MNSLSIVPQAHPQAVTGVTAVGQGSVPGQDGDGRGTTTPSGTRPGPHPHANMQTPASHHSRSHAVNHARPVFCTASGSQIRFWKATGKLVCWIGQVTPWPPALATTAQFGLASPSLLDTTAVGASSSRPVSGFTSRTSSVATDRPISRLTRGGTRGQLTTPLDMVATGEDPTLVVLAMKEKEEAAATERIRRDIEEREAAAARAKNEAYVLSCVFAWCVVTHVNAWGGDNLVNLFHTLVVAQVRVLRVASAHFQTRDAVEVRTSVSQHCRGATGECCLARGERSLPCLTCGRVFYRAPEATAKAPSATRLPSTSRQGKVPHSCRFAMTTWVALKRVLTTCQSFTTKASLLGLRRSRRPKKMDRRKAQQAAVGCRPSSLELPPEPPRLVPRHWGGVACRRLQKNKRKRCNHGSVRNASWTGRRRPARPLVRVRGL